MKLSIFIGTCAIFAVTATVSLTETHAKHRRKHGFTHTTLMEYGEGKKLNKNVGPKMDWDNYHRFDTIFDFVTTSALAHSDIAFIEEIGKTVENRSMTVVKIGRSVQNKTKPAMFIEAGIHPNEWISPAVTSYFINQLLNNYTFYEDILAQVDTYILPIANPDGYEFAHTNDRMYRKNRRPDPTCPGVNLNVNFGLHWEHNPDKCDLGYGGPTAFSEPETANIRDYLEKKHKEGVNWIAYFAMHSYGQVWLLPWGWTEERPEDFEELKKFADIGVAALTAVHGTPYDVMTAAEFEPGAGSSQDWVKGVGIFKYSQTLELRDTGEHGQILPPEQIIPTAEETWAAIQANAKFLAGEL